jgi:NTE family protein
MAGEPADIMLTLRLGNVGILDFDKAGHAIDEGVNCVHRMAPVLRHTLGILA